MRFNVAQLFKEPVGSSRQYDFDEDIGRLSEDVATTEPTHGHVKLVTTGKAILVQADVEMAVELDCSRCLDLYGQALSFHFEEEFFPTVDVNSGLPVEAPDEEGVFTIGADHVLDLGEAVRQYALVALPMAPLCRVECVGLCPQCGQNLNQGSCTCQPAPVDSRWEALRGFVPDNEDKP